MPDAHGNTWVSGCARRDLLGLPLVHIDAHYWRNVEGRRVESTPAEWVEHHRELLAGEWWIIDGTKLGVLPERLDAADTVIYLDLSTQARISGVLRRRVRFRGQLRPELGVHDRVNWEFVRWIWSFRRRQRPLMLELLRDFDGEVIVVTRRRDLQDLHANLRPSPRRANKVGQNHLARSLSLSDATRPNAR
jgi:adenylate kinase family enzyme